MNYKNFAFSLVATPPSPATTGTSLIVSAGEGSKFPDPPFYVTIWPTGSMPDSSNAEVVLVTAKSSDTLTIARIQDDTSARTVIAGDTIANTINAATVRYLSGTIGTQVLSVTVENTLSESSLIGTVVPTGSTTLRAGFFTVGKSLRIIARGYRTTAAAAGTLIFRVKLGSTTVLTTDVQSAQNNIAQRSWELSGIVTCRSVGSSGTVMCQGRVQMGQNDLSSKFWEMQNSATSTINTTITQAIGITVQWGTASASNIMVCTNMVIESFN